MPAHKDFRMHACARSVPCDAQHISESQITSMAHREFTDSMGRRWQVWSVVPERAERRRQVSDDDPATDRRKRDEFRVSLGERWARGWLCFESGGEKRRLAPFPAHWDELPAEELEALCSRAVPTLRRPRRLVE